MLASVCNQKKAAQAIETFLADKPEMIQEAGRAPARMRQRSTNALASPGAALNRPTG